MALFDAGQQAWRLTMADIRKRGRPDAAEFARNTLKKFPNVMAHLAEAERQEKTDVSGEECVASDDRDRTRPDFAEIATQVTEKYPTVLAHLAELERQEKLDVTTETDTSKTPEEPKS